MDPARYEALRDATLRYHEAANDACFEAQSAYDTVGVDSDHHHHLAREADVRANQAKHDILDVLNIEFGIEVA
jgi:hypothetical protein